MVLLISVLVVSLAIGLYFLRLMGDGRRLEARQRLPGFSSSQGAPERETLLFEDAPLWTARFFSETEAGGPFEGPSLGR